MDEQQIGRQLDAFLRLARDRGIEIRHELLEPGGGGICEIRGKPCLFLDLSSGPAEQLESIRRSLSATPPSWPVSRDTST